MYVCGTATFYLMDDFQTPSGSVPVFPIEHDTVVVCCWTLLFYSSLASQPTYFFREINGLASETIFIRS